MLLLSSLTLVPLQEGLSLYTHCHSFDSDHTNILQVQYNIALLGGLLVAHVNVVVLTSA